MLNDKVESFIFAIIFSALLRETIETLSSDHCRGGGIVYSKI